MPPGTPARSGSEKPIRPDAKEPRELFRLPLADGALSRQDLGAPALRPGHRPEGARLQAALFQEERHHPAGRGPGPRRIP